MSSHASRPGRSYVLGFLVLMVFDAVAQISFKLAGTNALPLELSVAWIVRLATHPWVYGAIVGYLGAFFTWMTILKYAPIGPAFAASHLEIVVVLILSHSLLGERIGTVQFVGCALILSGIVCLGISESRAPAIA